MIEHSPHRERGVYACLPPYFSRCDYTVRVLGDELDIGDTDRPHAPLFAPIWGSLEPCPDHGLEYLYLVEIEHT